MFYIYTPAEAPAVYPFSLTDLRRLYPNVSWPSELTDDEAADFDCYPVQHTTPPEAPDGQKVVRGTPERVGGVWYERWALVDLTAEEIKAQWAAIRAERNARLAACDWTQLPDAPVDASAWAAYRQALRDITTQPDPFNITWPEEPAT